MIEEDELNADRRRGKPSFSTTQWSVVLAVGGKDSANAAAALAALCQTYWYPLYAYVRRRGYPEHDAEDLIQGFFAHILERGSIERACPERGKFRSFLLGSINNYLADQRDRAHAQKRGGDKPIISMDDSQAQSRYQLEPSAQSPAEIFERQWALATLGQALTSLEEEYSRADKSVLFAELRHFLLGEKSHASYSQVGARLRCSEGAVKMAVLRLRRRYREIYRETIARTLADPRDVDDEIRCLKQVMAG
jgi:RNA polymerase sigma factor (sigma-70 family)